MIKENIDSVCFVGKITEVTPIENADKIELAKIGDWQCIVGKNQHKINDLVIVCTTDAVIPEDIAIQFNIKNYLRKGNRVRTVKLKGVYSECLLLSLDVAKKQLGYSNTKFDEGEDMQDTLKIYKYEEPEIDIIPKVKKVKFNFRKIFKLWMWKSYYRYLINTIKRKLTSIKANPNFKVYFKFPNIKNVPDMFHDDELVTVQLKIHGSNARYYIERENSEYSYWVGSHRVVKDVKYSKVNFIKEKIKQFFIKKNGYYKTDIWTEISDKYRIKDKLIEYMNNNPQIKSLELYGEIYGQGVQGDFDYGLDYKEVVFFDIQLDGIYLSPGKAGNIIYTQLGLPVIETVEVCDVPYEVAKNENYFKYKWGKDKNKPHEGVVIKAIQQGAPNLRAVKRINPEYLLYADKNNLTDFH